MEQKHAEVAARAEELAADKAYDSADNKAKLYDEYGIKPIIDHRQLWKEDPGQPRPLYGDRADVFLYDELGRLCCHCPAEQRGGRPGAGPGLRRLRARPPDGQVSLPGRLL
jgi:hypothetical protein